MDPEAVGKLVVATFTDVVQVKKTYDFPVFEIGRPLPALVVVYDGFEQEPMSQDSYLLKLRYECALYLPLETQDVRKPWVEMQGLAGQLVDVFRDDPTLDDRVFAASLDAGEAVVHAPADPHRKPIWIGHTFAVTVGVEEEEDD